MSSRNGLSLRREQSKAFNSYRWGVLRWEIAERAGYRCELNKESVCEVFPGDCFEIDHIVPRYLHKSIDEFWDEDNLQYVCKPCHYVKSRRELRIGRDGKDEGLVDEIEKFEAYLARG